MNMHVTLYSKPDCHLCEEMKSEMAKADIADFYDLQEINIETDSSLLDRYRHDIPVLLINGVEAFRHRLAADEFATRIISQIR